MRSIYGESSADLIHPPKPKERLREYILNLRNFNGLQRLRENSDFQEQVQSLTDWALKANST